MRLLPCGDKLFFYDRGSGDVLGFDKDGNSLSRFNHKEPTSIQVFIILPSTKRKRRFLSVPLKEYRFTGWMADISARYRSQIPF